MVGTLIRGPAIAAALATLALAWPALRWAAPVLVLRSVVDEAAMLYAAAALNFTRFGFPTLDGELVLAGLMPGPLAALAGLLTAFGDAHPLRLAGWLGAGAAAATAALIAGLAGARGRLAAGTLAVASVPAIWLLWPAGPAAWIGHPEAALAGLGWAVLAAVLWRLTTAPRHRADGELMAGTGAFLGALTGLMALCRPDGMWAAALVMLWLVAVERTRFRVAASMAVVFSILLLSLANIGFFGAGGQPPLGQPRWLPVALAVPTDPAAATAGARMAAGLAVPGLLLLAGLAARAMGGALERLVPGRAAVAAATALAAATLAVGATVQIDRLAMIDPDREAQYNLSKDIRRLTGKHEPVGTWQPGVPALFAGRRLVPLTPGLMPAGELAARISAADGLPPLLERGVDVYAVRLPAPPRQAIERMPAGAGPGGLARRTLAREWGRPHQIVAAHTTGDAGAGWYLIRFAEPGPVPPPDRRPAHGR